MSYRRSLRTDGRKQDKNLLDRLFAAKVKARDGWKCRLCQSGTNPQCAHLFSRRYMNTRWDFDNAWTLCQRCHFNYTKKPDAWTMVLEKLLGRAGYERLQARAFAIVKPDFAAVRLYLESA